MIDKQHLTFKIKDMQNLSKSRSALIIDTVVDTKKIMVSIKNSFTIRKDRINKSGLVPVYLNLTQAGKRKRIHLEIYVKPKDWNQKKSRTYKDDAANLMLDEIESSITNLKTDFYLQKKTLTIDQLVYEMKRNYSRIDFLEFMKENLEAENTTLSSGTYRRYYAVYRKLKKRYDKILFSDFNREKFDKIKQDLSKINKESTVESNLKCIKKYLRLAKSYDIRLALNPDHIKIKKAITHRKALNADEVEILHDYYDSKFINKQNRLALGYFLFSCYTGLRYSDVIDIERNDITDSIELITKKNKKHLKIKLNNKALSTLKNKDLFVEKLSNQKINKRLKNMLVELDIKKKISFHCARNTFATNYIKLGGNVVVLKDILSHSSIKTTMVYVKMADKDFEKNMDILDKLF